MSHTQKYMKMLQDRSRLLREVVERSGKKLGRSAEESVELAKRFVDKYRHAISDMYTHHINSGASTSKADALTIEFMWTLGNKLADEFMSRLGLGVEKPSGSTVTAEEVVGKPAKKRTPKAKTPKATHAPKARVASRRGASSRASKTEPVIDASVVMQGARKRGRKPALGDEELLDIGRILKDAKSHHLRVWLCAGPVATGCGGSTPKNRTRVRMNLVKYPRD